MVSSLNWRDGSWHFAMTSTGSYTFEEDPHPIFGRRDSRISLLVQNIICMIFPRRLQQSACCSAAALCWRAAAAAPPVWRRRVKRLDIWRRTQNRTLSWRYSIFIPYSLQDVTMISKPMTWGRCIVVVSLHLFLCFILLRPYHLLFNALLLSKPALHHFTFM